MEIIAIGNIDSRKHAFIVNPNLKDEGLLNRLKNFGEVDVVDRLCAKKCALEELVLVQFKNETDTKADVDMHRICNNGIQIPRTEKSGPQDDGKRIRFVVSRQKTTNLHLYKIFSKYGALDNIFATMTQNNERKFGFARFNRREDAEKAIREETKLGRGCWPALPSSIPLRDRKPGFSAFKQCPDCSLETETKNANKHNEICQLQLKERTEKLKEAYQCHESIIERITKNTDETITVFYNKIAKTLANAITNIDTINFNEGEICSKPLIDISTAVFIRGLPKYIASEVFPKAKNLQDAYKKILQIIDTNNHRTNTNESFIETKYQQSSINANEKPGFGYHGYPRYQGYP